MNNVKHICFDKDGVIIDVHAYWSDIIQKRALKLVEVYDMPKENLSGLALAMGVDLRLMKIIPTGPVGYKSRNVVIDAALSVLKEKGVKTDPEKIANIFIGVDQQMQRDKDFCIRIIPGADQSLKDVKALGVSISLFSSDRKKNMKENLKQLKIEKLIDGYVGGDSVRNPKPHPEGFELACQAVGVRIEESIYVGDTLDDMIMAQQTNCLGGYGVTTGLMSKERLNEEAKGVFDSLGELVVCLRKARKNCTTLK